MDMLTAYFDDSGGRDTNTVVIAGYVAPDLQWQRFTNEWNTIMNDPYFGLPEGTIFHMREFAHSLSAFRLFKDHKRDEDVAFKRQKFIERLVSITKIRATMSFSCSFRLEDYRAVNKEYFLKETFGGPFAFAARTCVGRVRQWAHSKVPRIGTHEIGFVFEDGMQGKGDLITSMARDGFPSPTFRPKDTLLPPLQAADLIAWEFHKAMKQAFENELVALRASFEALLKMPGDNGVFTTAEDILTKCVVPLGVQRR
jgi:hypothetical protein